MMVMSPWSVMNLSCLAFIRECQFTIWASLNLPLPPEPHAIQPLGAKALW